MSLLIKKVNTGKHLIEQRKLMEMGIIPNHPGISIFSASQSGGKSTLVNNMLTNELMYGPSHEGLELINGKLPKKKGYFDAVFLFCGSPDDMYENLIEQKIIKQNHVCLDPTPEALQTVIDGQKAIIKKHNGEIHKSPRILFILDDVMNNGKLLRSKPFLDLFVNGRHINSSTFLLAQYLNLIPRPCRVQSNWTFVGKSNLAELTTLTEQYCPTEMSKKEFQGMVVEATNDDKKSKNNFFVIVKRAAPNLRFRKNLDQYISLKRHNITPKTEIPEPKSSKNPILEAKSRISDLEKSSFADVIAEAQSEINLPDLKPKNQKKMHFRRNNMKY